MRVSNSEMSTFLRCKRKYWLVYYRKLRLKRSDVVGPRALGTRVHIALAAYYSPEREHPLKVLQDLANEDLPKAQEAGQLEAFSDECDLAAIMIEGYLEWLRETGADDGLTIVAPERAIEVKSAFEGVTLIGKLDVQAHREWDNRMFFIDHKTTNSFQIPTLHLDPQFLMYMLLQRLEGSEAVFTDGALMNMLKRVKRTKNAKPPFYDRAEVHHNEQELRAFYTRVHGIIKDILALHAALDAGQNPLYVAYPTPKKDCSWDCDFLQVCGLFDDGSRVDDMLADLYEVHDPHERYETSAVREQVTEVRPTAEPVAPEPVAAAPNGVRPPMKNPGNQFAAGTRSPEVRARMAAAQQARRAKERAATTTTTTTEDGNGS